MWTATNLTYTADAAEGLVAWLTSKAANYTSRIVVTLPSGTVPRGNADLTLPSGMFLVLQGQGMAEAGGTTLDLERNNLDIGGMLGEGGRIEFRNMRICNVLPALPVPRSTCVSHAAVCAGLCGGASASPLRRCGRWSVASSGCCTSNMARCMLRLVLKQFLARASGATSSLLQAACFCVHATLPSRFSHDPRRMVCVARCASHVRWGRRAVPSPSVRRVALVHRVAGAAG